MTDFARKLCNELMGVDRDKLTPEASSKEVKFTDPSVCRYQLVSFCPHALFPNTKSDLGPCEFRHHDELLKADYMINGEAHREAYERQFLAYLATLVADVDRRVRRAKDRLESRPSEQVLSVLLPNKDLLEERSVELDLQIKDLLARMEEAGEEGRVQEAQDLNRHLERLQAESSRLREEMTGAVKGNREMEVCDVCGAMLISNDVARRLDTHFEGKQHLGYTKIREELDRLSRKYSEGGRRASPNPEVHHYRPSSQQRGKEARSDRPSTRPPGRRPSHSRSRSPPRSRSYHDARPPSRRHPSRSPPRRDRYIDYDRPSRR